MVILESITLGIVQGITEFLPISSSAHLVIIPWLFGWTDPTIASLSFDVALHLGTLLAILIFFRRDVATLFCAWVKSIAERKIGSDQNRRLSWFLLFACIPGGIAGLLFEGKITEAYHIIPIPGISMLLMAGAVGAPAIILLIVDRFTERYQKPGNPGLGASLIIGLAQALAIFPGVSRSGVTITAGLACGLKRQTAARFSFLLAAPIIAGAGLKSAFDFITQLHTTTLSGKELIIFPIGFLAAAVSGLLCIKFLIGFLRRHSFLGFAIYRLALALFIVLVVVLRQG